MFKSGKNSDISNYGPTYIQLAIPKVLEEMLLPILKSNMDF